MENQPADVVWFFIGFPVFFVGVWFAVGFLLAEIGGWRTLASRFRCTDQWRGSLWRFQSAEMGFSGLVRYSGCLNFGVCADGLYIAPIILFRTGHSPLLIPWNEITVHRDVVGLIFKRKHLVLGRAANVPLRINVDLATNLKDATGSMWPAESAA